MCGLVGFFVGCDLAVACPKRRHCQSGQPYKSAFGRWDSHASVRRAPNRVRDVEELAFPADYVPVLKHARLETAEPPVRDALRKAALFRFLNFTHKLEMVVVNSATANIALGHYDTCFNDALRLDAHRIYVDEAYHALFSFELMTHMQDTCSDTVPLYRQTPAFVRRTYDLADQADPADRTLIHLLSVIVSEMLITSTLQNAATTQAIDPGVGRMMADHARDEARHHAFYRHVLIELWPKLADRQRDVAVSAIYDLLLAYTAPDLEAMRWELSALQVAPATAEEILEETYTEDTVRNYALACGRGLFEHVRDLCDARQADRLAEHFQQSDKPSKVA